MEHRALSKTAENRGSLSAQDWVDGASDILAASGIDAVRVEPLARTLNVTKGSFYWHFSNRRELFDAVLQGWRKRATSAIIQRLDSSKLAPIEQLTELLELPRHGSHAVAAANLEIAIRQWARRDSTAKAAVDEVDQHRITFIEGIYKELKYDKATARVKAALFYSTMQGISNLPTLITDDIIEHFKTILAEGP